MTTTRTIILTSLALVAFAANSVLCRVALGGGLIDAASFSTIRLASGALALLLIIAIVRLGRISLSGGWLSAILLFLYAVGFSLAYTHLGVGTGALILFGSVQATMLGVAAHSGERSHRLELAGIAIALIGVSYLVFPGLQSPSPLGAALMVIAGVSWGFYTLRGRSSREPMLETAGNFVRAVPLALIVSLTGLSKMSMSGRGVLLAVISGAIASGCGYVIWYTALRGLTGTQAAMSQLLVPILAALGGIAFMSEVLTVRLLVSSILILGGVVLGLSARWNSSNAT